MTEQPGGTTPGDDASPSSRWPSDDTEGHFSKFGGADAEQAEGDDTEGHEEHR